MKLIIDTSGSDLVAVALKDGEEVLVKEEIGHKFGSQVLLKALSELFRKRQLSLSDISEVEVDRGPGSFTGLRVGVSVANAIGYALGITVNGKQFETDLVYEY